MSETIGSDECAALLRCTPEQVEEMARAGDIPGLKIGRSWLFMRSDLLAYLVSLTAVMEPPMFGVMEPQTGE